MWRHFGDGAHRHREVVVASPLRLECDDIKVLAKQLNKVVSEDHLLKQFHGAMRDTVVPVKPDIQAAVRAIPSKGTRTGGRNVRAARKFTKRKKQTKAAWGKDVAKAGLRDALANAVGIQVSATGGEVAIRIFPGNLPASQRGLPFLMEGQSPWIHPTFGHRPIVTQPAHPFFDKTIERHIPRIDREMNKVYDDFVEVVSRNG
jgi:hypothetical protein